MVAVVVASSVGFSLVIPLASADDLIDQRQRVQQQLTQTQVELNESSQELTAAAVAVDQAQTRLAAAQAQLARTRRELTAAKARDVAMATKLRRAQADLAKAKAAVTEGQQRLDAETVLAGAMMRDAYQQQTNLLPIAILVQSRSTADLQTRLQWSTTMLDTTQALIDQMTVLQRTLNARRARQTELETQIAADRVVAGANLVTRNTLERRASLEAAGVAELVRQRTVARAVAQRAVEADRRHYAELNKEAAAVEHRIAVRIAQAKAEAARKAAAARAAKVAAEKAAAARAAKVAAEKAAAAAAQRAAAQRAAAQRLAAERLAAHKAAARKSARLAAERAAAADRAHRTAVAKRIRREAAADRAHRTAVAKRIRREAAAERSHQAAVVRQLRRAAAAEQARLEARERASRRAQEQLRSSAREKATSAKKDKSSSTKSKNSSSSSSVGSSSGGSSASHGFSFPVSAPITSPYGQRFHPVLHIWKLHDGTDFGAGCGTAIRAAYSGRVAEKYYSGAYGNRLMIDHGEVDGRYVTTGYNHAIRYIVGVGQRVSEGQVIGYVGTTGYSTGCHLHLMVWLDGNRVNPMSWF